MASLLVASPLLLRYIPLPERRQSEEEAKVERQPNGNLTGTERESFEEQYENVVLPLLAGAVMLFAWFIRTARFIPVQ